MGRDVPLIALVPGLFSTKTRHHLTDRRMSVVVVDRSAYVLVLNARKLNDWYDVRHNVVRRRVALSVVDGNASGAQRFVLIARDQHVDIDWRVGDVYYVSCARCVTGERAKTVSVQSESTVRRAATAEEVISGGGLLGAALKRARERDRGGWFGDARVDNAMALMRTVRAVKSKGLIELVRVATERREVNRRESFGSATYTDSERLDPRERTRLHFLGRVTREEVRRSSWRPEGRLSFGDDESDGEQYARRVVWARQTKGGRETRIHLPPAKDATERARASIVGDVLDVRNAIARWNANTGTCELVCDARRSTWRTLGEDDSRRAEVVTRVPESEFSRELPFSDLASAMRGEFTLGNVSSLIIVFDATVKWLEVCADGANTRRRVPPALDASDVPRMTCFACDACSRELNADANGVYKLCHCDESGRGVFTWREITLGLQSGDDDDERVVEARVLGDVAQKLLLNVNAGTVLGKDSSALTIDYPTIVCCAVNALAVGRRNRTLRWSARFPVIDENGIPRRNGIDLVNFEI